MSIRNRLLFSRPPVRLPSRTIRLRLTIIYAGLFLACGTGLLAVTYVLVREATGDVLVATKSDGSSLSIGGTGAGAPANGTKESFSRVGDRAPRLTPQQQEAQTQRDRALATRQHDEEMRVLLEKSGIALAIMAAASIVLGWLAAGRMLRPLRTLNERAREISASDLHKRLSLEGPEDEVTRLADTFDDLLGRLEASFAAQRQFVANASHELRTPLARARTLAEVALSDPDANVDSLRASHRRVLAAGKQQERLIEALLTLARSERGLDHHEPFDLAAVTDSVVVAKRPEAERRGLGLRASLQPAETSGDMRLAERLITNLVVNAIRHNRARGSVDVSATIKAGRAVFSVANTGPNVPPEQIDRLVQPFERLTTSRTDHSEGIGLGLSIVSAIATAHDASLAVQARPPGGLHVEVSFARGNPADGAGSNMTAERKPRRRALPWHRRKTSGTDEAPTELAPVR